MIATLNGVVAEKMVDGLVIDVQGVGYEVLLPLEDNARLSAGDSVRVYVYEHIRENAHDLYGFTKTDTKELFEQLIAVNGVGPKMALNVLSIGSVEDVRQAIASGDTKFITAAPSVGKKVAERVVVDLKDKVGLVSTASVEALFVGSARAGQDEAVQGLIALGYSLSDAVNALAEVEAGLSTEERIRQALKGVKT